MEFSEKPAILLSLSLLCMAHANLLAEPAALPAWFEENRVQAHFENSIQDDIGGLYRQLHPAVRSMGAEALTRIFKTVGEGAWWPTAAGETHEAIGDQDLALKIARDAHANGLKVIAYYRIMCDDFIEREHPDWLCRDAAGDLVLEPRTRRRPNPEDRKHVLCFNSPAKEMIEARLLELANRGVDGIYFDSWHMPEVCTCEFCRAAYLRRTGKAMDPTAERGSADYRAMTEFVAGTIVRNFRQWKQAVKKKHPAVLFAIGSSLYPCFDRQMQITASLLEISDTSKTEFSKPFGGFLAWPLSGDLDVLWRRPYMDKSFALPAYDVQNALGWSLTRDSCDGRPPLMWIPFTQTEDEALFSTAAAVSYGCVASIHPSGLWARRSPTIQLEATRIYRSSYELGEAVSPWLGGARPSRFTLIHISERSRNARIANPRALWVEFFAPILGVFESLKEDHLPLSTINDLQLEQGIPDRTALIVLPHAREVSQRQRTVLRSFEEAGGKVLRCDTDQPWHLRSEKTSLKQQLLAQVVAEIGRPPIQVRGPAAMHAVFFEDPAKQRTIVCLANDFGWFRSERETSESHAIPAVPPSCRNVVLEVGGSQRSIRRVLEAVTGKELTIRHDGGKAIVDVPDFRVMACIVLDSIPNDP
ncbi:MAG: hypothetical protein GXY83_41130 [Rhodopirellula sp.]|nr:hypothetical protein [Rhodopirellula sp.]